ncbi:MAG TPA: AAA family ATPase [Drouetiella sp.]
MWIERIDFAGFGNISGEKIEFKNNKLNLVVESNEYGKSTIASAVWAILYDFPEREGRPSEREARRPNANSKMPYIASIDITNNGTRLKIIRDFNDGAVQVVDRDQNNKDVTRQFRGPGGEEQIGLKLTGMTREMFRSTCFVGQRELDEHVFEDSDLAAMFQGIADTSSPATNAGDAIDVLNQALQRFPYKGRRNKVDAVLRDLEGQYYELSDTIKKMENDRVDTAIKIKKINELGEDIVDDYATAGATEYFELCLEAADTDNRLIQAQSMLAKVSELRQELNSLGDLEGFPIDSAKQVEELLVRRQSRQEDLNRFQQDVAPLISGYEAEGSAHENDDELNSFTMDDGRRLGAQSVKLHKHESELLDLRQRRGSEYDRLSSLNIDLNNVTSSKQAFQNMSDKDSESARSYMALLDQFKLALNEAEEKVERSRLVINDIDEQRKAKKVMFVLPGGALRKRELEAAEAEVEKETKHIEELNTKVKGLEAKLDTLAKKVGIESGEELLAHFSGAGGETNHLRELQSLDRMIEEKEGNITALNKEIEPLFLKAGRQIYDVNAATAAELAERVQQYVMEKQKADSKSNAAQQSKDQFAFLSSEIENVDNSLNEIFAQAHIEKSTNREEQRQEFFAKLANFHRWQMLTGELRKMEGDMSSGFTPDELPPQIERLESNRMEIFERMHELIEQHPAIAEMAPPMLSSQRKSSVADGGDEKTYVDDLRRERDELTLAVRSATMNHDQNYLSAVEEQEQISRELNNVRRAKTALELARDTLQKLSSETYVDWSAKLNDIAREMILNIGLDFESLHFDQDLKITARKRGETQDIDSTNINTQLSVGTKEQLHWLARMVVSQFLSKGNPLPIVLDEPFSEADDERFLRVMQFLIEVLSTKHQVIIFSCHQQRHHWLLSNLDQSQIARIDFARRASMRG